LSGHVSCATRPKRVPFEISADKEARDAASQLRKELGKAGDEADSQESEAGYPIDEVFASDLSAVSLGVDETCVITLSSLDRLSTGRWTRKTTGGIAAIQKKRDINRAKNEYGEV
jgi:hypothetical protein